MFNIPKLFANYGIEPEGVIHIGAHTGQEAKTYKQMGIKKVLLIEANPEVFKRLEQNVKEDPEILAVNCAICDYNGEVTLRVTSNDESSSILPLKYHKEIYPHIVEIKQIKVKCRTLRTLLGELNLNPLDFDFINIDIQGAELLAFQGATELLGNIKAIITEVNLKELYEGCALIGEIDTFLGVRGFIRKELDTSNDPSWGDALYIKQMAKPKVTIYIVAYNAQKYIAQAVDSVLAQTCRDFELIIVNDGSRDKTEQIIKSYSDDRINYIYQEHKNFAAGMNRAIAGAKGEYVLGVDSDDYIAEDYLEKMVNFAEDFPDIDYFYPDHFVLLNEFGNVTKRWDYLDFSDNTKLATFLPENDFSPIPNQGSLKRKSIFERTGLYEEVETCEDFAFLCKNALKIRFKRVENSSDYFYRRLPSSNSHKSEARKMVHAKALSEMADRPHLLICSPWDNCWLRYFKKYFGEEYEVKICKYSRDVSQTQDAIDWADIVFFNWSDWFLNYWSNQEKRKDKKYIAFLRSYEIWDTNNPWEVNWNNIDHLIFVNPLIRQCFLDNVREQIKGEFNTPTHFIPNGIDLDEWNFIDRKPNRKIAWVNDLCHKKGIQLLVQFAFHIPYNYSIFPAGGEGDLRRSFYFNYITHAMRINNKISPIKRYKNVQEFLRNKGYALCTSVVEGHPNALLEAMAVGIKPIIHNFPGASILFPEEFVWNTIEEAIKILQGDYQPSAYRAFVETNYDMRKLYGKIKELL